MSPGRSLDRRILAIALPTLATLLAEPAYLITDTVVVARLGTTPLAALAVAQSLVLLAFTVFIFLTFGTSAAVARLRGAGDEAGATRFGVQSIWLGAVLGVGVAAPVALFAPLLVRAVGASPDVAEGAVLYLRISTLGFPAILATMGGTGFLRGAEDTRAPFGSPYRPPSSTPLSRWR